MLIWMDAWSLAPMILLLAELKIERYTISYIASYLYSHKNLRLKLTIYEGRKGPQIHQRRFAWWRFWQVIADKSERNKIKIRKHAKRKEKSRRPEPLASKLHHHLAYRANTAGHMWRNVSSNISPILQEMDARIF